MKDGKVGVLYSPGFGAGWSTWHHGSREEKEFLLFDPELVGAVEAGNLTLVKKIVEEKMPDFYLGGLEKLKIEWVCLNSLFEIMEYDGSESIHYKEHEDWFMA